MILSDDVCCAFELGSEKLDSKMIAAFRKGLDAKYLLSCLMGYCCQEQTEIVGSGLSSHARSLMICALVKHLRSNYRLRKRLFKVYCAK